MRQKLLSLSLLTPKKKYMVSCVLGALMALSQAPIYFTPIILLSFTGLLFLSDAPTRHAFKQMFWLGWFFGLGYHVAGLYWIAFALGVDIAQFWWLVPFAVLGLPAFFAIWSGLALAFTNFTKVEGIAKVFLFASLWALGEWVRGHFLTGFPWNLLGYTWLFSDEMLQVTSVIGIYGLTILTILLGCVPYLVFKHGRFVDAGAILGVFVGVAVFGILRLQDTPTQFHENVMLRIVQPNISQDLKWDVDKVRANYLKVLKLSTQQPATDHTKITHVIWPESAIPFYLEENTWRREEIMSKLPEGSILLTGGLRRAFDNRILSQIWNSFLAIGPEKRVLATYDKSHLVPFGEYVPLRQWLPGLVTKITYGSLDFSPGPGPQTLEIKNTPPFSPLICYEGIFPGKVTSTHSLKHGGRPQWMLNVTNDAWYGTTSGPFQHFGIIRVRAVEEGVPMVRAANTGVSGIFDAYGRVHHELGLNKQGFIDAPLPKPLSTPTFYAQYKDLSFWVILLLMLLRAVISVKLGRVSQHTKRVRQEP